MPAEAKQIVDFNQKVREKLDGDGFSQNLELSTNPTSSTDNTLGVKPGSIAINTSASEFSADRYWICYNAAAGAAVWFRIIPDTNRKIVVVDGVGGQDINSITPTPIIFNNEQNPLSDSNLFTWGVFDNSSIYVTQTASYLIEFHCYFQGNNTRKNIINTIRINGDDNTLLDEALTAQYLRNSANPLGDNSFSGFSVPLIAGDRIELVGYRGGDTGPCVTLPGSWLSLELDLNRP